jgi:hypothetical protein
MFQYIIVFVWRFSRYLRFPWQAFSLTNSMALLAESHCFTSTQVPGNHQKLAAGGIWVFLQGCPKVTGSLGSLGSFQGLTG